ncbi:MAG: hypothetical protein DRQ58_09280 [Gammaproteobacteria bacterium]|nr:MAG: hypothetical protein DRQ58_09280 [Gammaproteobacteria bacterium]
MALESALLISQLVETNPTDQDDLEFGDDHIRMTKSVLKYTFPGANGQGFNQQILATEADINGLQNLRDNVQVQLDALEARIIALEA